MIGMQGWENQREYGQIKVWRCLIEGLLLIEPTVHRDGRGRFVEVYNAKEMRSAGIDWEFVQENLSRSRKGVLRGLHFQRKFPQCKLARVVSGTALDVAVDLRHGSPTFGKWHGAELSGENHRMLLIPEGFAHGILALTDNVVFCYKCSDYYHPDDESGIAWNDPLIGIDWPVRGNYAGSASADGYALSDGTPLSISEKDQGWPGIRNAALPGGDYAPADMRG